MTDRATLAQHGTEFCLAAGGFATGAVGIATAAVPLTVLAAIGADRWATCDTRLLDKAKKATFAALTADRALTDADILVASEHLRGYRKGLSIDIETLVTAFASQSPGTLLFQAAFPGGLPHETEGVRTALRLTLETAALALRNGNYATAFTTEAVSRILQQQKVQFTLTHAIKADTAALRDDTADLKAMIAALTAEVRGDKTLSAEVQRMAANEKLLIALAERYAEGTPQDFDAALRGLERALEVAAQRPAASSLSDHVDQIVAEADRLSDAGELDAALAHMTAALADSADRIAQEHQALARLRETAIRKATLARAVEPLAALLVQQIAAEHAARPDRFIVLRHIWMQCYERGRDQGLAFDLEVAIALARHTVELAQNADHRGAALNDLGTALRTLGERDSDNARLEQALSAFTEALQVRTRDRVPLDWAMTQNNLGNTLHSLGTRDNDSARLEQAVTAYNAALQERSRDGIPLDWAATQNNLGNALQTLGTRDNDTARLEQAVTAYTQALRERTRDRVPLDWAMTQNNLGTALQTLGIRDSDTARLEQAVTAYTAALQEFTRDRVPLDWAMTQNNLGNVLSSLGGRDSDTARMEQAVAAYREALQEYTRDRVPQNWAMTHENLALAEMAWADSVEGEQIGAHLRAALAHVDAALQVYTPQDTPFQHSKATRLRDHLFTRIGAL